MRRRARSPRFDILVSSFIAPVACITFQAGLTPREKAISSRQPNPVGPTRAAGQAYAHIGRIQWAACDTILGRALVLNFSRARDGFTLAFELDVSNFGAEFGRLW